MSAITRTPCAKGDGIVRPISVIGTIRLIELDGLTIGIVGFGKIGQMVGKLAEAFGMKVLTYSRKHPAEEMEKLFRQSDVISLHCPLTPETKHLVNEERLAWMKPTALLLNTSRGPLIDEPALAKALNEGRIAGAGLDVLAVEPPSADNPLLQREKLLCHSAHCLGNACRALAIDGCGCRQCARLSHRHPQERRVVTPGLHESPTNGGSPSWLRREMALPHGSIRLLLLRQGVGKTRSFHHRRRTPFAGQRCRLRGVEAHGQIERPLRRRQPVGFLVLARAFVLEVEV